jgi:cellulose synthase/poly-beta-1,6-N-acetylglucosamine synthase-like glycosyltransferase
MIADVESRLGITGNQLTARETTSPEVSIVIPCFNETDTLETCIEKALRVLGEHHISGEIIVAKNV